jgi:uncharacterized protein
LEISLLGSGVKQKNRSPLRINVGFLLCQSVGFSREFEFEEPTVQVADDLDVFDLNGTISFTRTAQGLYAHGRLSAQIPLECVRCLTEFPQELTIEIRDLFIYPPEKDADPLLVIPETAILDLSGIIREYLILEIPLQPLCHADCSGLCPICGKAQRDGKCEHPQSELDPRMAVLQTLLEDK